MYVQDNKSFWTHTFSKIPKKCNIDYSRMFIVLEITFFWQNSYLDCKMNIVMNYLYKQVLLYFKRVNNIITVNKCF